MDWGEFLAPWDGLCLPFAPFPSKIKKARRTFDLLAFDSTVLHAARGIYEM